MDSRSNLASDMQIKCGDFGAMIDHGFLPSDVPLPLPLSSCCERIGSDGGSKVDHRNNPTKNITTTLTLSCRVCGKKGDEWTLTCPDHPFNNADEETTTNTTNVPKPSLKDDGDSCRTDFWRKNANNSVVVTDISDDTRDIELDYLFAFCGHVARVDVNTYHLSGGSTIRCGFVSLATREEAVKAIEKYNGYWFDHTIFTVKWPVFEPQVNRSKNEENNRNTVVVTRMPEETTDTELDHLFNRFGDVIRAGVATVNKTSRLTRRFGFVTFANREDAGKAIEELNGYCYMSVILRLRWATPRPHCPAT